VPQQTLDMSQKTLTRKSTGSSQYMVKRGRAKRFTQGVNKTLLQQLFIAEKVSGFRIVMELKHPCTCNCPAMEGAWKTISGSV
jgi:hypothetical protein